MCITIIALIPHGRRLTLHPLPCPFCFFLLMPLSRWLPYNLARALNRVPPSLFRWRMELPVPQTAPLSVSRAAVSTLAATASLAPKKSSTNAWCAVGMALAAASSQAPSKNSGPSVISFIPLPPLPAQPPFFPCCCSSLGAKCFPGDSTLSV